MTKRGLLIVTMLLVALLLMGNGPAPNAYCMGKQPGDSCTVTGGCSGAVGTCYHDDTTGFHDDPNTPEDEALLCFTGGASPASPLEAIPTSPLEPTKP